MCVRVRRAILYIRCARRATVLLSECYCLVKRCYVSRVCARSRSIVTAGRRIDAVAAAATPDLAATMPSDENKADAREDRLQGPMRLLHKEREHVRKQMLKDARQKCDETRDAYVACAKGERARHLFFFSCAPVSHGGVSRVYVPHSLTLPPPVRRPHDQPSLYVPHALQGVQHMPLTTVRALQLSYSSHGRLASRLSPRAFSQHVRRGD